MWTSDVVQFARLIAELEAAGAFDHDTVSALATSMDVRSREVIELKDRAVRLWEEVRQHANPAAWIEEVLGSEALRSTSFEDDRTDDDVPAFMDTSGYPAYRVCPMSYEQMRPAARLFSVLFPPGGTTPFTWQEHTSPDAIEAGADPVPFADYIADLFGATGVVVDVVEIAPRIDDIVIPGDRLDAAACLLRNLALFTSDGKYVWEHTAPAPEWLPPGDSGITPQTASWLELHRETKRPWIASAAGLLSAAGAHIVAEDGEPWPPPPVPDPVPRSPR